MVLLLLLLSNRRREDSTCGMRNEQVFRVEKFRYITYVYGGNVELIVRDARVD